MSTNGKERPEFILKSGGLQDKFLNAITKVIIYGGGFGNGKTTALVLKILRIATEYPGANILAARSTYPKLNDTFRKEFLKWCPPEWIKSFPTGQNASNICTLTNGTTINFRYIAQQGRNQDGGTSNLLSATYDLVAIDQIEDPEIVEKDFLDLFGRLRGQARYIGSDPTKPRTGPRQFLIACNPTRNWFYKRVIRPYHLYLATGEIAKELLCERDIDGAPVYDVNSKLKLIMELIEGSTYELRHIHERDDGDFIKTLETMYTGQMRDRFLLGKWSAYEGLVYPEYDVTTHTIPHTVIMDHLNGLIASGYEPNWIEGYDFGIASPSCYGLSFVDPNGCVFLVDGFYQKEMSVEDQITEINRLRKKWAGPYFEFDPVYSDPDVFRRKAGNKKTVGMTIAEMFRDGGIEMRKGNNDILNGIVKIGGYIKLRNRFSHPILKTTPAPRLIVASELHWFSDEMGSYYWQTNSQGDRTDRPVDDQDHAMDMLKYMLTDLPDIGGYVAKQNNNVPSWMKWSERDQSSNSRTKGHRYGR